MKVFGDLYRGRTVLVTGHTGFKGSWLSLWLTFLGAKVVGYSAYLPSDPCNFSVCGLDDRLVNIKGDVRDLDALRAVFLKYRPDIVFHLAAQPLVLKSYEEPKLTFDTNAGGTVNVLECLRTAPGVVAAVLITSDKCYHNAEWLWGYRENDRLGGDDLYSASKACAEIAANAYIKSFFGAKDFPRVCTVRAGNVIGGGDWAPDRIVPDCVRAWAEGRTPRLRNPNATRPWQIVMEPLSGYLCLGAELLVSDRLRGEAFNFGPNPEVNNSVRELVATFVGYWGGAGYGEEQSGGDKKESNLLKLSCDKALHFLKWHAALSFEETVRLTAGWYKAYYTGNKDMFAFSRGQLEFYISEAEHLKLPWTE